MILITGASDNVGSEVLKAGGSGQAEHSCSLRVYGQGNRSTPRGANCSDGLHQTNDDPVGVGRN
jgi:hypothetical protein